MYKIRWHGEGCYNHCINHILDITHSKLPQQNGCVIASLLPSDSDLFRLRWNCRKVCYQNIQLLDSIMTGVINGLQEWIKKMCDKKIFETSWSQVFFRPSSIAWRNKTKEDTQTYEALHFSLDMAVLVPLFPSLTGF